jgi:hypothetical protein
MRSDILPGAIFPDYELSDHTAKHRKLSELQGQDPMVLVLSRGDCRHRYAPCSRHLISAAVNLKAQWCELNKPRERVIEAQISARKLPQPKHRNEHGAVPSCSSEIGL